MWNRQDAMLIAGRTDDAAFNRAAREVIADQIIPDARRRYIPELSLHSDREAWVTQSDVVLHGLTKKLAGRLYYRFDRPKIDWRARMQPGLTMQRIGEDLLRRRDVHHIDHVAGWVGSFWRSVEDFVTHSFGYTLLKTKAQGEGSPEAVSAVSWCLAVYVSGSNYELGLATVPDHRRQGYATLVAAASVEQAMARGAVPHWHCWADNAGSIATAARVGFVDPKPYTVYRIML
jgi:GNAT superfamily N-acetyltransferase